MPPQPGDDFIHLTGPNKGQIVRVDDLTLGGPQIQAYPAAPDGTVRSGPVADPRSASPVSMAAAISNVC